MNELFEFISFIINNYSETALLTYVGFKLKKITPHIERLSTFVNNNKKQIIKIIQKE